MKYNIPFSPPDISNKEIKAVEEVLKSGWITTGPKTKEFEKQVASYCGTNCSVAMNSATACLEMTLRLLDIGPDDEVITSAYTYSASASIVSHVGAKLVLVDTKKDSFEMDYDKLSAAITSKTKVIIPVEIGGVICDYDTIFSVVNTKKELYNPKKGTLQEKFDRVIILSDSAHAFGSQRKEKKSGSIADFTCFSFHAVKNLTTGEGGAVTWKTINTVDDNDIYKRFNNLILHGQTKDALSKTQIGSWEYDIIAPNYKFNMTDINASIGLVQLERYEELLNRRKQIIEMYNKGLKDLPVSMMCHYTKDMISSGHLYLMRINNFTEDQRNKFIKKMGEHGIATNVHYKPLPMLTAYKNLNFDISDYPNAYNLYKNEVTLPLHTRLLDDEIHYIVKIISQLLSGEMIHNV